MSGLEALSLACNVITVITFALDTAKVCQTIRKHGSADPDLRRNISHIGQTFADLEIALQQTPTAPTHTEMHVRELAIECKRYAEDLNEVLDRISPKASGAKPGCLETFKSTTRTFLHKRQIEDHKNRLEAAQSTMNSTILVQILNDCIQSKALTASTYNTFNQRQKDILDNNNQIKIIVADIKRLEDTQAYEKLLGSLKYDQMNARKNDVPHRHHDTFEWIFEDQVPGNEDEAAHSNNKLVDLAEWLREDSCCLYWVNGKPGSGKSTFMKFIEHDPRTKTALEHWQKQLECRIISHFLWKVGTEDQHSLKGMLCSLFHQVLCEERNLALQLLCDEPTLVHKKDMTDWDLHDVERHLFSFLRSSSSAYFILLDGLDELHQLNEMTGKLFSLLDDLAAMGRVKICVSSRPERPFADKFKSNQSLRMQDLTEEDIRKYTTDFLKELHLQPHEELHSGILNRMIYKAEGVFLWVYIVLQNIKHDINHYGESWDDIYERVTQLPPDLMRLYKDMWSRLGDRNEKYVRQAARYFQYISRGNKTNYIAVLAVIVDDDFLDVLAKPGKISSDSLKKWVKMCQDTYRTLSSVSVGLLEVDRVDKQPMPKDFQELRPWVKKHVGFIHRTAIDFVESDESKDLLGKHTLGDESYCWLMVKAQLAFYSVTRSASPPSSLIWHSIIRYERDQVTPIPRGIIHMIYRCAIDESRRLLWSAYSICHENSFFLEASFFHPESFEDIKELIGDNNVIGSTCALIGACHNTAPFVLEHVVILNKRARQFRAIKHYLEEYLQYEPRNSERSGSIDASEGIMLAWRCFLLHETPRWINPHKVNGDQPVTEEDKRVVEDILELFIKCGVMAESPGPKYLIVVQSGWFKIVKRPSDQEAARFGHRCLDRQRPSSYSSSTYCEVNDAQLVLALAEKISARPELISLMRRNAFARPILADKGTSDVNPRKARFFHINMSENNLQQFAEWIFEDGYMLSKGFYPDKKPSFLEAVDVGEFERATDALEAIDYVLPDVNKKYNCLHSWIGYW